MNQKLISSPGVLGLLCFIILAPSCEEQNLLPETGYNWPEKERSYWPTRGWETAPMEEHQVDPEKMNKADRFAGADPLARALIVVKDGYLVFEKYYGDGDTARCSNLWSVTKSFSSALVGILLDQDYVVSTHQLMAALMPDYPQFNDITLHHVLTMSTGLKWEEEGKPWVDWIFSDDWVAEALARGSFTEPGKTFKYSSGNSHFLTALIHYKTGMSTGSFARQYLFDPLGIEFEELEDKITYTSWEEYLEPLDHTWRKDPLGIETASFGLYLTAREMAKLGYLYLNRGKWENRPLISESWIDLSTREYMTDIYGRYSYGYQWFITLVDGVPSFLASGFGGQIIGVVPALDLVVVIKYDAEDPVDPAAGTAHDDMHLFDLVVQAVK